MSDETAVTLSPDLRPVTINDVDERIWAWIYQERERTHDLLLELVIGLKKDELFVGPVGPPGHPGERGEQGPPGKLPVAKVWLRDSVFYEGEVVTLAGATWQAICDTGTMPAPGARDWLCLAAAARTPRPRGTFDASAAYEMLDIVSRDRATFIARCDNPGECPGDGWQVIATQGHRGERGLQGEKGERGPKGEPGVSTPAIVEWQLDRNAYEATPILTDGSAGPPLRLRELFQQFLDDVSPH